MESPQVSPIRVGMIAMSDLGNPDQISGMPYRMAKSLKEQGIEIVPIQARARASESASILTRAGNRVLRIHHRRTPMSIRRLFDRFLPNRTRTKVLRAAESCSAIAQINLDELLNRGEHLDALFGCCISSALFALETDLPIVYFSDATSLVLEQTYPSLARRGRVFRKTNFEVERAALHRTDMAIFAAPNTERSAQQDFGMPAERTRVVAMGAHVYPEHPEEIDAPASPPTRGHCDLLIVAADPIRKRVDLATQVAEILRGRGINATLHVVGRGTKHSNRSDAVESVGPLRLSDPGDRARHQALLSSCHLQLLPSLGEAFGIAPAESAHFARPSIVSSAGGLPFVVLDGQTGIVIDVDAQASAWADAVESLIDDPLRYRAMSQEALGWARAELNWSAWGASVGALIREQINARTITQRVSA